MPHVNIRRSWSLAAFVNSRSRRRCSANEVEEDTHGDWLYMAYRKPLGHIYASCMANEFCHYSTRCNVQYSRPMNFATTLPGSTAAIALQSRRQPKFGMQFARTYHHFPRTVVLRGTVVRSLHLHLQPCCIICGRAGCMQMTLYILAWVNTGPRYTSVQMQVQGFPVVPVWLVAAMHVTSGSPESPSNREKCPGH